MPDFVPAYLPADGDALTAQGLNNNLYRVTSGRSIYEVMNGHIEAVNFDPAFQVVPHHVRPGQAGEAISVGSVIPLDYFSDLNLGVDSARYIAIAGACVTFYQRYDVAAALFGASGFVSVWRQFGPANGAFATRLDAPNIMVKAFVAPGAGSMTMLEHTERKMPQTVFFDPASTLDNAVVGVREAMATRSFNIVHPRVSGGTGAVAQLTKGWHTFGLACIVRQNLTGQDTTDPLQDFDLWEEGDDSLAPKAFYSAIQRMRIYARSVTAVRLL